MNDVFTLNSAKIHFSIEIPLVQNGSIFSFLLFFVWKEC